MKANLIYHHKARVQGRYVLEMTIHEVRQPRKGEESIKYGLICYDSKTAQKVLLDNH